MEILQDEKRGLVWRAPVLEYNQDGDIEPKLEDKKEYQDVVDELNSWQSKNILEYLTHGKENLGDYINQLVNSRRTPYMAYEDGNLVGTVLIENNSFLEQYVTLRGVVTFCEEHNIDADTKNFLSIDTARQILTNYTKSNNTSISLFAVKGSCQGKGVGTRCIQSINDNMDFFSKTKNINTINAFIHEDNVASIKVFEKNGFKRPYRWYNNAYYRGFDTYYKLVGKEK